MGFRRSVVHDELPVGDTLIRAMAGLGMAFDIDPLHNFNIEDTLLGASVDGMERDDLRVLGLAVAWLDIHHARLNVDRLTRAVPLLTGHRCRVFWAATADRFIADRRWARLARLPDAMGPADLLRIGNSFQMQRRGEDQRFAQTRLRVPAGTLRQRPGEVLEPSALALRHDAYRQRIIMGASYRADAWAVLQENPERSASVVARLSYASFATAWQVKRDFQLVAGTTARGPGVRPG